MKISRHITWVACYQLLIVCIVGGFFITATLPARAQYDDPDAINTILQQGDQQVVVGELLLNETFDQTNVWEVYEDDDASALTRDGSYYMSRLTTNLTMWAQNLTVHDNVVMIVDTRQISSLNNNTFGMMCRASEANDANGYYLRISGDGYGFIGVNDEAGDLRALVNWVPSPAIVQGQALNRLMVVCVDDYLAVYANGTLVAETTDTTLSRGVAGFSVANFEEEEKVEVEFDNLEIYSASIVASTDTNTDTDTDDSGTTGGVRIIPRNTNSSSPSTSTNNDMSEANLERAIAIMPLIQQALTNNPQNIQLGNVTSVAAFESDKTTWELLNIKDDQVLLTTKILDGQFVIYSQSATTGTNEWALDLQNSHTDAVIYVQTEQLSPVDNNGYGVSCRTSLDNNGDGYYFRISGDAYYSIASVVEGEFTFLVNWTQTPIINTGQSTNEIVVACVEDYLAMYVNGILVAEANDTTFTEGTTALSVVAYEENSPTEVAFDNVTVVEARK